MITIAKDGSPALIYFAVAVDVANTPASFAFANISKSTTDLSMFAAHPVFNETDARAPCYIIRLYPEEIAGVSGTYPYTLTVGSHSYTGSITFGDIPTPPTPVVTAIITMVPVSVRRTKGFYISGTLTANGVGISKTVGIQRSTNNTTFTTIATKPTDSAGKVTLLRTERSTGTYYFRITYAGDATYAPSKSNVTKVMVTK